MTANGIVSPEWEVDIHISELGITVTEIMLDGTPAVLSLGKLTHEEGFDYIARNSSVPYLEKDGHQYYCYPTHDVPFITSSVKTEAKPSPRNAGEILEQIPTVIHAALGRQQVQQEPAQGELQQDVQQTATTENRAQAKAKARAERIANANTERNEMAMK